MKLKSRLLRNNWLKEMNGPAAWNYWFRNFKLKINSSKKSLSMKWRLITSPTWKKESNTFQNWFIPSFKPQDRWSMNRQNHKKGKGSKLHKTISKNHKSRSKSSNPAKRMELKQQGHFNKPNHIKNYRKIKYRVVYKLKVHPKDQQSMVTCLYFKAVSSSKMPSKYWPAKIIRCKCHNWEPRLPNLRKWFSHWNSKNNRFMIQLRNCTHNWKIYNLKEIPSLKTSDHSKLNCKEWINTLNRSRLKISRSRRKIKSMRTTSRMNNLKNLTCKINRFTVKARNSKDN